MHDAMAEYAVAATIKRHDRTQERAVKSHGHYATAGALGLTEVYLQQLSSFISQKLSERPKGTERISEQTAALHKVLRQLDPDLIALCTLQVALHSVAVGDEVRDTCLSLGGAIAGELWAAKLLTHDKTLTAKIEKAARRRHGGVKQRKQATRSAAAQAGFRVRHWSPQARHAAGNALLEWLRQCLS